MGIAQCQESTPTSQRNAATAPAFVEFRIVDYGELRCAAKGFRCGYSKGDYASHAMSTGSQDSIGSLGGSDGINIWSNVSSVDDTLTLIGCQINRCVVRCNDGCSCALQGGNATCEADTAASPAAPTSVPTKVLTKSPNQTPNKTPTKAPSPQTGLTARCFRPLKCAQRIYNRKWCTCRRLLNGMTQCLRQKTKRRCCPTRGRGRDKDRRYVRQVIKEVQRLCLPGNVEEWNAGL